MDKATGQLQQLGFSQYEAQAYIALLRENPVNGYELAKASGIPRSNIYLVLQKLEERGAVLRLDTPDGARYAPMPPSELLARLKQHYQGAVDYVSQILSEIAVPTSRESILNMRGYGVLLDQARALIDAAQHHLLLSIWPEEALALIEPLQQARDRGLQMTTLCLRGCQQPCPACPGAVFRYAIAPAGDRRWLVLVADDLELLAGEITQPVDALAVRTQQKMLVNLTAGYIQNSIALAAILNSLGERLDALIDPHTRAAIDALHPLQAQGRWLDVMREMIHSQENHL